jgi:hypothetical protein
VYSISLKVRCLVTPDSIHEGILLMPTIHPKTDCRWTLLDERVRSLSWDLLILLLNLPPHTHETTRGHWPGVIKWLEVSSRLTTVPAIVKRMH